jgi:hypothetical protein
MYLFSISSYGSSQFVMMRIFRKMRNLRMTYALEHVESVENTGDAAALSARLSSVYNDRKYTIINPRFSQDGRPTVKVEIKPRLLVDSEKYSSQVAATLRKALVPVEAVIIHGGEEREENDGMGFGGDYVIPANDLADFFKKMYSDGRVLFADEFNMPEMKDAVLSKEVPQNGILSAAYFSAAISVWFGEHKKQVKTHSAGGRIKI